MEEQKQLDKIDQATEKALKQVEKERKNKERDYISSSEIDGFNYPY